MSDLPVTRLLDSKETVIISQYVRCMNEAIVTTCCSSSIRCVGQQAKSFSLLPAAELGTSPSISRLMNAAALSTSSLVSSKLIVLIASKAASEQRKMHEQTAVNMVFGVVIGLRSLQEHLNAKDADQPIKAMLPIG